MLHDPTRKFVFIHIWKTGGESVVSTLRQHCPSYFRNRYLNKAIRVAPGPSAALLGWRARLVNGQHFTAQEIRNEMPADAFDEAFKFTFVRNPWDWQVSNYAYALQTPAHGQHDIIRELGSFDAYVRYQFAERAPSQGSFILDDDGQQIVDFVGRFETLQQDFQTVCEKIGVTAELPFLNASKRKQDWRDYYTDETRSLVEELFDADIQRFGYSWDG